jgi:hypothetical protein
MTKLIIETRSDVSSSFRTDNPTYSENPKLVAFLDKCVRKKIILNYSVDVSGDGLTQTRTFNTESPALLDCLRDFYFPGNQNSEQEWASLNNSSITEVPPFNPDLTEEDLKKFVDFIGDDEIMYG